MDKNIKVGSGDYSVEAQLVVMGDDLVLSVIGGTHPHVGAVALGIPRPSLKNFKEISSSVSVLSVVGHKDDHVARSMAEYVSASLNKRVVVIAGIHIDNASETEIKKLIKNCKDLAIKIVDYHKQCVNS